jgi:hypothetical protein
MNDFEHKLRRQPFRPPPPDLREAILGAPSNVVTVARWTWRDWFWPSPQAWAGLAALWAIFAAVAFQPGESVPPPAAVVVSRQPAAPVTFLSFHQTHHLDHVLELSN